MQEIASQTTATGLVFAIKYFCVFEIKFVGFVCLEEIGFYRIKKKKINMRDL